MGKILLSSAMMTALGACASFALYTPVEEVEPQLPLPNERWQEIGKIKNLKSGDISDSRLSIGFECLDRDIFEPEKVYDKLAETGIKYARCQTGWSKCEKEKGKYDFKWLDDIVDNLLKRGINPWFNVGFGNGIYMGEMKNPTGVGYVPLYFGDECLEAWKNYIRELAKRYKGKVRYYEIWNESNINNFWQPKKADPIEYAKLIKITGEIIKEINPDAKIGACIASCGNLYQMKFFKNGGGEYIDFFSIHTYCILPEERQDNQVAWGKELIKQYAPNKKIDLWQGESGFASSYPEGHYMKTVTAGGEYMQAKWMLRRFTLDIASGIAMTSLFQCVDLKKGYQMAVGGTPLFGKYGIIENETYRPKKAYHILKNFTPIFDSQTTIKPALAFIYTRNGIEETLGASRLVDTAKEMKCFERKGYPLVAYWLAEDMQTQMKAIPNLELRITAMDKEWKTVVLLDPISGKVFKYKGKSKVNIQNIPMADYPLIVTDLKAVEDIIELNK